MKTYNERTQSIEEKAIKERKRRKKRTVAITSALLSFIIALNLTLFIPYQVGGIDLSDYEDSAYYPVIEQLCALTHDKPKKTNNFNRLTELISDGFDKATGGEILENAGGSADTPTTDETNSTGNYNEVTNNQTAGVIEGDLFKRSDEYIYYINYVPYTVRTEIINGVKEPISSPAYYLLQIYSIEQENSRLVSETAIHADENTSFAGYTSSREMFLSQDCSTVTLFTPAYDEESKQRYTVLISLDVSNAEEVREIERVYVSGAYVSARVTKEQILLISNFSVAWGVDYSNPSAFLPQIGSHGNLQSLPLEDIILPQTVTNRSYTVVCSFDEGTLQLNDSVALLSFSDEVYVSQSNLFVTRSYSDVEKINLETFEYHMSTPMTEIRQIGYENSKLEVYSPLSVKGRVNDRFSLDEYEGVLRIFTTSFRTVAYRGGTVASGESIPTSDEVTPLSNNASLYCIDLATRQTVASVERFAPDGERVMSARFYGDTAYVCTAIVYETLATDPVYAFDLSNYQAVTYTDTGTIPGYSLSLVPFTNGTLLGIGYGDGLSNLNISLYVQTQDSVEITAQYQMPNTTFSEEFKAYFIDAENGLVGLWTCDFQQASPNYLLLRYDGYELNELKRIEVSDYEMDDIRATYIDGYFYLLGNSTFTVIAV